MYVTQKRFKLNLHDNECKKPLHSKQPGFEVAGMCICDSSAKKNKTKNVSNYAGTEIEKTNYEIHELYTLSKTQTHIHIISKDEMVLEECNQ